MKLLFWQTAILVTVLAVGAVEVSSKVSKVKIIVPHKINHVHHHHHHRHPHPHPGVRAIGQKNKFYPKAEAEEGEEEDPKDEEFASYEDEEDEEGEEDPEGPVEDFVPFGVPSGSRATFARSPHPFRPPFEPYGFGHPPPFSTYREQPAVVRFHKPSRIRPPEDDHQFLDYDYR